MRTKYFVSSIDATVDALKSAGLYPVPHVIFGSSVDPEIIVDGRKVLLFSSANYLGLGNDPRICYVISEALKKYGLAASASRLISGTQDPHVELEQEIAKFQNEGEAIIYFAVTLANAGSIAGIMNPPLRLYAQALGFGKDIKKEHSVILADQFSHPSVMDACILAQPDEFVLYKHCNVTHLEDKLKKYRNSRKMIVTDGLFSGAGDLAPLKEIVALAKEYEAIVFCDDAHGTGVLGENGRGTWELLGVENEVDIKVGSLSKAFGGGLGGFVAGSTKFIEFLRVSGRHYIFGGSIPPAVAKGITEALRLAQNEKWRRERVLKSANFLRLRLNENDFDTFGSKAQIVPILIGDERKAVIVAEMLNEFGIFAPSFRYPAVPRGKACIRVNLMATHTDEHLENFLKIFCRVAEKNKVLQGLAK